MATVIDYHGQACVSVSYGSLTISTDPWMTPSSQFLGWNQSPPPLALSAREVSESDFIYISHDHEDHYDVSYLKTLSRPGLIVPNFRNQRFHRSLATELSHLGKVVAEDGVEIDLGEHVKVTVYLERPPYRINSACIIETPDVSILNLNDCGVDVDMLKRIEKLHAPDVFLYSLNFAANAWPLCFTKRSDSLAIKDAYSQLKKQMVEKFGSALHVVKPAWSYAFAGPISFAAEFNQPFNRDPDMFDWSSLIEAGQFSVETRQLLVGDRLLFESKELFESKRELGSECYSIAGKVETEDGQGQSATSDLESAAGSFFQELESIFRMLGKRPAGQLKLSIVPEGVDPSKKRVIESFQSSWLTLGVSGGVLNVFADEKTILAFIRDEFTYDTLQLSQMAYFERHPDVHDSVLHDALKFGRDKFALDELIEHYSQNAAPSGLFEVGLPDGSKAFVPKFCPHEGESFDSECVDGVILTCPRHHWKFDITSGVCVRGGSLSLYGN